MSMSNRHEGIHLKDVGKNSALRTDSFIRKLNSSNAFDVISADVVLARMEKQGTVDVACITKFMPPLCKRKLQYENSQYQYRIQRIA
ncbi:TPA: hypothetical protein PFA69_003691 [Serratia marcescens]|nr:hypothetical protein [Serratia marcescens]